MDFGLREDFINLKNKGSESKTKWMRLYQTEKLLLSERNHQENKKANNWMGEDICKQHLWWRFNIQNL